MTIFFWNLLTTLVLFLIQGVAAIPWMVTISTKRSLWYLFIRILGILMILGVCIRLAPLLLGPIADPTPETVGMTYGYILHLQLIADFFILSFPLILWVWPKGGAVALAAFREGVRQPLFWVLGLFGLGALAVSPLVPYFTFGEDLVMVKDLGFDFLMLAATLFGALAASQSISEEIEGRTAITLMSKPVSRRQFLLGKFVGIVMAALLMYALLGWVFQGILDGKVWLDRLDATPPPAWLVGLLDWARLPGDSTELLTGVGLWLAHALDLLPGLVMTFTEVTVLTALAVALATRATMVVNLATVLAIYVVANVTPVLVAIGHTIRPRYTGDPVPPLLSFTAGLFDMLLPDLDAFRIGPALVADAAVPAAYVLSVMFYGALYTFIVILFGLILFEDRDLA
jgi:hypothetical protein